MGARNGLIVGAGVGALIGAALGGGGESFSGPGFAHTSKDRRLQAAAAVGALGGGVGAGCGALIGSGRKKGSVLYSAADPGEP